MPNTFFIADTHFNEEEIIRYEARPFANVCDMNEQLIARWNDTVSSEDVVFHLGDIGSDVSGEHSLEHIFARLHGHIVLVRGNHDTESDEFYRNLGITEINNHPIIVDGFWMLSHEPLYVSRQMPYANVFGHVHGCPMYRTVSCRSYCVSVERTGYAPVSFSNIRQAMTGTEV